MSTHDTPSGPPEADISHDTERYETLLRIEENRRPESNEERIHEGFASIDPNSETQPDHGAAFYYSYLRTGKFGIGKTDEQYEAFSRAVGKEQEPFIKVKVDFESAPLVVKGTERFARGDFAFYKTEKTSADGELVGFIVENTRENGDQGRDILFLPKEVVGQIESKRENAENGVKSLIDKFGLEAVQKAISPIHTENQPDSSLLEAAEVSEKVDVEKLAGAREELGQGETETASDKSRETVSQKRLSKEEIDKLPEDEKRTIQEKRNLVIHDLADLTRHFGWETKDKLHLKDKADALSDVKGTFDTLHAGIVRFKLEANGQLEIWTNHNFVNETSEFAKDGTFIPSEVDQRDMINYLIETQNELLENHPDLKITILDYHNHDIKLGDKIHKSQEQPYEPPKPGEPGGPVPLDQQRLDYDVHSGQWYGSPK